MSEYYGTVLKERDHLRAENERLTSMLAHHVSEPVPDGDPVRELGSFLCDALDDDQWAHVERMLNGFRAAIERKDTALRQIVKLVDEAKSNEFEECLAAIRRTALGE